jgi:CxxC motif-containing protein
MTMTKWKKISKLQILSIIFVVLWASHTNATTLRWSPSSGSPSGYKVYYGTNANNPSKSKDVGNKTSYNIDQLPLSENVRYYFRVSAYNAQGESAPCPPVGYTPGDSTPPSPPKGLASKSVSVSSDKLAFSAKPNRSEALALEGRKLKGNAYIFLDTRKTNINQVTFFIDGLKSKTEKAAPYDLAGSKSATAFPYNTTKLKDGRHVIMAEIKLKNGSTQTISAPFYVQNNPSYVQNNPSPVLPYKLAYSTKPDRSKAVPLEGRSLKGEAYIFLDTKKTNINQVTFYIDGRKSRTEKAAPYDLAGSKSATAFPYNATNLKDGRHVIMAEIKLKNGSTQTISAPFKVIN